MRDPTPRTVSMQRVSPSCFRVEAICKSMVRVGSYNRSNSLGSGRPRRPQRAPPAPIDRPLADLLGADGVGRRRGSPATARIRSSSTTGTPTSPQWPRAVHPPRGLTQPLHRVRLLLYSKVVPSVGCTRPRSSDRPRPPPGNRSGSDAPEARLRSGDPSQTGGDEPEAGTHQPTKHAPQAVGDQQTSASRGRPATRRGGA
jgi:hypothetical protein